MIDHVTVPVSDFEKSKKFYEEALKPLGYSVQMELEGAAGLGDGKSAIPDLWIAQKEEFAPVHVAFSADRAGVEAFHQAALEAGARDNGPPGIRAHYHESYYGAYVHDFDGNNIEAVSHTAA